MELKEHLNILNKNKIFIIIFTLVVIVSSLAIYYYRPINYKATISFDVNLINRENTTDYQYGSYYDLKGAEIFTQNAMSWLRTSAVIEEIYQTAGVGYEIKNLDKFTNRFKTSQYGAQNFIVSFTDLNKENGEKIASSIGQIASKKAEEANKNIEDKSLFELVPSEPTVVKNEKNYYLILLLSLLVGSVFGSILVYLKHYLRNIK